MIPTYLGYSIFYFICGTGKIYMKTSILLNLCKMKAFQIGVLKKTQHSMRSSIKRVMFSRIILFSAHMKIMPSKYCYAFWFGLARYSITTTCVRLPRENHPCYYLQKACKASFFQDCQTLFFKQFLKINFTSAVRTYCQRP